LQWVQTAATGKKMNDKIAAEEYQGGPFATIKTLNGLITCYENAVAGMKNENFCLSCVDRANV
jgi:hypothetical protein